MKKIPFLMLIGTLLCFTACRPDNEDFLNDDNDIIDINDPDISDPGNTNNTNLVELGRLLFWDPILSGDRNVSCATCHHPDFAYADGRALSIGVDGQGLGPQRVHLSAAQDGFVRRNSPTIINTAFNGMNDNGNFNPALAPMFWDNRVVSLEAQALGPLVSFEEMRGHAFDEDVALDEIVNRLRTNAQYPQLFENVFGNGHIIDEDDIGTAIAAFERTITATNSPFDRFQAGDENAMSQQQIRGMNRFNQIGCDNCHSGPMFSDFELHTLGVPDHPLLDETDAGANGDYEFRTPTLRNLNDTGPYFHNGVGSNLQQTIQFYITARNFANNNNGGGNGGGNGLQVNPNVNRNDIANDVEDLNNFNNDDIQDIIAFIQALDDPDFDRTIPATVPSGLNPGGNIGPN